MRTGTLAFAATLALASTIGSAADGADRYDLVKAADKGGAILYDTPLTTALARCYGRYDAAMRDGTKGHSAMAAASAKAQREETGKLLEAVAKADEATSFRIATLAPPTPGEPYGELAAPAGAPVFYPYYEWGLIDFEGPADAPVLASCNALVSAAKVGRGIGNALEPVYRGAGDHDVWTMSGQPYVLALAYCGGQIDLIANDFLKDDPSATDLKSFETAVIAEAKRDRNEDITLKDFQASKLPFAIADAWRRGREGIDTRPPDFDDTAGQIYQYYVLPPCQAMLKNVPKR